MTKKCFCDACGVETKRYKIIAIPCHLMTDKCGYVNNDMDPVSGRDEQYDLCEKCINIVYGAAAKALRAMQSV